MIRTARRFTAFGAFAALITLAPLSARAQFYNFLDQPITTPTPFSDTQGGVTATFSSPADPGAFQVETSFFETLTGNVVVNSGAADSVPLIVSFNKLVTSASLNFATDDPLDNSGPPRPAAISTFLVEAFLGGITGTPEGSSAATGSYPTGFDFPEGTISITGVNPFDTLELSASPAPQFAIGDLSITTGSVVPEPGALGLIPAGIVSLLAVARRRR